MRGNAIAFRASIALVAALVLTPAVLTAGQSWLASSETLSRPVTLQGPIVGFSQSHGKIEVRLDPVAARNAGGDMLLSVADSADPASNPVRIELRNGQTFASARLPDHLAAAPMLSVTVESAQTLAAK